MAQFKKVVNNFCTFKVFDFERPRVMLLKHDETVTSYELRVTSFKTVTTKEG